MKLAPGVITTGSTARKKPVRIVQVTPYGNQPHYQRPGMRLPRAQNSTLSADLITA